MFKIPTAAIVAALLFAALARVSAATPPPPAAAPSTAASPTPDPAVLARAKDWFHRLQTGNIDRSQLDAAMSAALTDATVKQAAAQMTPLGAPVTFEQQQTGSEKGSTYYVYSLAFGNGVRLTYIFSVDAAGKISGLRVAPAR